MKRNVKKLIKEMSFSDHVTNMVKALKRPHTKVEMRTFGKVIEGICCSCAATNALCRLANKKFTGTEIETMNRRARFLGIECKTFNVYESAIDYLREGNVHSFLLCMKNISSNSNFKNIDGSMVADTNITYELGESVVVRKSIIIVRGIKYTVKLPKLETENYKKFLCCYELFAQSLKNLGL